MKIKGIAASEGVSIAKAFVMLEEDLKISNKKIKDTNKEIKSFEDSKKIAKKQIQKLYDTTLKKIGKEKADIFGAHLQILDDPAIKSDVEKLINEEKFNAAYSLSKVADTYVKMFESMNDDYMKERASDIRDVTNRLLKIIQGIEILDLSTINHEVIIFAHDLTPSQTAQMNPKFVKGFITEIGGRTSHSAIMARTLEIPAVVGCGNKLKVKNNEEIIISGTEGIAIIKPSKNEIQEYKLKLEQELKMRKELDKFIDKETVTADGKSFEIAGNIGNSKDVDQVIANGGEAIGLFRSEFLYMDNSNWPTEEEQFEAYSAVAKDMKGKKVIIRTLDIGGDKKLDYFSFPKEENPFLGYRAVRFTMDKKEVFKVQIRALLRAAHFGKIYVNIPMIATIKEFLDVKKFVDKQRKDLEKEGIKYGEIKLGIMVEIPSVAILADKFAKHVDFFSVGTNDLIQYTFAADRMSEKVSYLYQPYNPSILRMLKNVIDASHAEGKFTAMCGEMASEPNALPLLIGMGLDEFSMSSSSILKSRYLISKINSNEASKLVEKALDQESSEQVIKLTEKFMSKI